MDDGKAPLAPLLKKLATDFFRFLIVAATTPIGGILKPPLHIDKEKNRYVVMQSHYTKPFLSPVIVALWF